MIELIELSALGFAAGLISAFFGVGGGIIMVPLLMFLRPELPAHAVIATSLSVILFNATFNTVRFSRRLALRARRIALAACAIVFFTYASSTLALSLSQEILQYIFATALIFIMFWMNRPRSSAVAASEAAPVHSVLIGLISGGVSGLTGLGGGAFNVPLLHKWLAIPFKEVSAYSNMIMIATAAAGTATFMWQDAPNIGHFSVGYVIPKLTIAMAAGSFLGSKVGIILHGKVEEKNLKLCFSILLILIIIRTLISAIGSN